MTRVTFGLLISVSPPRSRTRVKLASRVFAGLLHTWHRKCWQGKVGPLFFFICIKKSDAETKAILFLTRTRLVFLSNHAVYGPAVDWWSLGTLIFEMLTGDPPFDHKDRKKLYQKIMSENPKFPSYLTASCIKLLRGLLDRNVERRLGAAKSSMFEVRGVSEVKKSPFFDKVLFFFCTFLPKFSKKKSN